MIAVVDYGAGNVCSVMHALEHIGAPSILTREEGEIARADAVILPGVGAFGDAMAQLGASGTIAALERYRQTGRPMLGICIGEQLLFDRSEESPGSPGLAWLRGSVRRIPAAPERKVPHMGWNQIEICRQDPLFAGLPENPYFYFVHSYYVDAADKSCVLARVEYGVPMGGRVPIFDIRIKPQKTNAFSKVAQNELAKEFYSLGFFNPANAAQALICLEMMDFEGKDMVVKRIAEQAARGVNAWQG